MTTATTKKHSNDNNKNSTTKNKHNKKNNNDHDVNFVPSSSSSSSSSYRKVATISLMSRLILLSLMSLSCFLLPDLNPGDDVLTFNLRYDNNNDDDVATAISDVITTETMSGVDNSHENSIRVENGMTTTCFCLSGYACDYDSYRNNNTTTTTGDMFQHVITTLSSLSTTTTTLSAPPPPPARRRRRRQCADNHTFLKSHMINNNHRRYPRLDVFYHVLLTPLTRWDAARFLQLAIDPWARYPVVRNDDNDDSLFGTAEDDHAADHDESLICPSTKQQNNNNNNIDDDDDNYTSSEQAHAFFPLLPLLIRSIAILLTRIISASILPATFEGVITLAALLLSIVSFVISSLFLYDLTRRVVDMSSSSRRCCVVDEESRCCDGIAQTVVHLYAMNPSNVFFCTAYSEATFAVFVFGGYAAAALAARGQQCQRRRGRRRRRATDGWLYFLGTVLLWTMASCLRSNGVVLCLGVLSTGVAQIVVSLTRIRTVMRRVVQGGGIILSHSMAIIIIMSPLFYHDQWGYHIHCHSQQQDQDDDESQQRPTWCHQNHAPSSSSSSSFSSFSLYSHVQRKHWNVGLFRYYQLKQIPNFLLAAPIVIIAILATRDWIVTSANRYYLRYYKSRRGDAGGDDVDDDNPQYRRSFFRMFLSWVFFALRESSFPTMGGHDADDNDASPNVSRQSSTSSHRESKDKTNNDNNDNDDDYRSLLLHPYTLPHYATLAAITILGTTIAHVQITTRMICSSCPAVYWYMAILYHDNETTTTTTTTTLSPRRYKRKLLLWYLVGFNVLGIVMHVNWLPWT